MSGYVFFSIKGTSYTFLYNSHIASWLTAVYEKPDPTPPTQKQNKLFWSLKVALLDLKDISLTDQNKLFYFLMGFFDGLVGGCTLKTYMPCGIAGGTPTSPVG